MKTYFEAIDKYLDDKNPDFMKFYNFFQDEYFGDSRAERNYLLSEEQMDFLDEVNDLMSLAGQNPNEDEIKDGIIDQFEFQRRLLELKENNISFWH